MEFTCFYCNKKVASIKVLRAHFTSAHHLNPAYTSYFTCGEPDCARTFNSWKSFSSHLHGHAFTKEEPSYTETSPYCSIGHATPSSQEANALSVLPRTKSDHNPSNISSSSKCKIQNDTAEEATSDADILMSPHEESPLTDFEQAQCESLRIVRTEIQDNAFAFLEKLHVETNIARKSIQMVTEESESLVNKTVTLLEENIIPLLLKDENISRSIIQKIEALFEATKNPFQDLSSEFLRIKYLTSKGCFIQPQSIAVDTNEELHPGSVTPVIVKATYIPIIDTLTQFFNRTDVYNDISDYMKSLPTDEFSNYIQSPRWKAKIRDEAEGSILPLSLYFDDFQINNVLGSHAGSGKTGGVYISLPVLPLKYRSKVENIFAVQLFRSEDREECGNSAMFKALINDLQKLYIDGITVKLTSGDIKIRFILGLLLGDNLGLNDMLGFVRSFSANYYCRMCKGHKDVTKNQIEEDPTLLRTSENYQLDLQTADYHKTGIRTECVWSAVPKFNPVEDSSVDPMHDLLSNGVCHFDLGEVINYLINDVKLLSLESLNIKIAVFNYGSLKGENVPPLIKAEDIERRQFSMSASEMLTFVRAFSVMIGDLVPHNDQVWAFYLLLRKILDIVFTREVTEQRCTELNELVREHHSSYMKHFNKPLKPKLHNLVHYPRVMRSAGPLLDMSCMRFESKNREEKDFIRLTTSRKNPTLTMAMKGQLKSAFKSSSLTSIKGFKYRPNQCLAIDIDDDGGFPIFGLVQNVSEEGILTCKVLTTDHFSEHYHAYVVTPSQTTISCTSDNLVDPLPMIINSSGNTQFVTLKHII